MPQPHGSALNGFTALAQFDLPQQGGNGDGVIDQRDKVYPYLFLWFDRNHNGVSDPGELLGLAQSGVTSMDLHYVPYHQTDSYGNRLRYRSKFRSTGPGQGRDHWVYDVVLVSSRH